MKTLIFFVVVLVIAIAVTMFAEGDPGYVLIARSPWSIEMSLLVFVPLLIFGFGALYALGRLIRRLWLIPQSMAGWRLNRSTKKARASLTQGLLLLAEGNWVKAQNQLITGLPHSDGPIINYLGAACASQALGDTEKRDEYVGAAQKASPQNSFAIAMTQAHLYSWTQQHEQALATLTELRTQQPKHNYILRLLVQTYRALNDWASVAELLPDLRRFKVLGSDAIDALELQAHRELLMMSLPSGSLEVLNRAWRAVPKTLRRYPKLIAIYCDHLIKQDKMNEAESLLREAIAREPDEELLELYGRAHSDDIAKQLETAENWLVSQPEDPHLLLTVGRLSICNELWGKARSYLESSIKRQPTAHTYQELGALMERLGEPEKALDYYRRGLETLSTMTPTMALTDVKPAPQRLTGTD
ncbi:MAG: heme biosynthesis protein HemY [Proteobacteria bacterium]|nr:MAG: heme biosynthesis protein HemY [Pseudomonadota bacterium]